MKWPLVRVDIRSFFWGATCFDFGPWREVACTVLRRTDASQDCCDSLGAARRSERKSWRWWRCVILVIVFAQYIGFRNRKWWCWRVMVMVMVMMMMMMVMLGETSFKLQGAPHSTKRNSQIYSIYFDAFRKTAGDVSGHQTMEDGRWWSLGIIIRFCAHSQ